MWQHGRVQIGERKMIAVCENCGGQVSTQIEGAKVDYCWRPNCAYGDE
jgi:hypothetical protein